MGDVDQPRVTHPMNGDGQAPTRGPEQAIRRLHEKMLAMRGAANRRRAEAEAKRVLTSATIVPQRPG
jgi:hypothetical protein